MGHVNESELEWSEVDRGETNFRRKQLGSAADKLSEQYDEID